MSSPADPFSILNRDATRGNMKPPPSKSKIVRYRSGKAPEWQKKDDEDESDDIYPNSITHLTIEPDKISIAETMRTSKEEATELNNRLARRREIHRTIVVEEDKHHKEEDKIDEDDDIEISEHDRVRIRSGRHIRPSEEARPAEEVLPTYSIPEFSNDVNVQIEGKVEEVVRRRNKAKERLIEKEQVHDDDHILNKQGMIHISIVNSHN